MDNAGVAHGSRSDLLVRVGAALFTVGLAATAIVVIPFFFGVTERSIWLNALAAGGLTVGFAFALAGIVAAVRSPAPVDEADLADKFDLADEVDLAEEADAPDAYRDTK